MRVQRGRGSWQLLALPVALLGMSVAPRQASAEKTAKVGFVDVQRVAAESEKGQQTANQFREELQVKQTEINAREQEIRRLEQELEKQALLLSEPARREREETIRRKIREVRRMAEDFDRDLKRRQRELRGTILKEVAALVAEYGKQHGYALIIDAAAGGVLYGDPEANLTGEILRLYDETSAGATRPSSSRGTQQGTETGPKR